ncbi:unnamed protein product [Rangifer tarandus platyrhynchus]|uniref:DUF4939 domain-containing protein n=1 Tax=Rangifer tarandus platyrhynchus TaxID=3082113 RepID=A0ABN9A4F6_RANTA|nr:unnamed protein product [Rangifer tarandus platyrhynchus]
MAQPTPGLGRLRIHTLPATPPRGPLCTQQSPEKRARPNGRQSAVDQGPPGPAHSAPDTSVEEPDPFPETFDGDTDRLPEFIVQTDGRLHASGQEHVHQRCPECDVPHHPHDPTSPAVGDPLHQEAEPPPQRLLGFLAEMKRVFGWVEHEDF